jgi:hypothetical protein
LLVLGLGLGMVLQVLVLATQNAVPYDELGVATSGATLFRSLGGSLGTAVLGAIFSARLTDDLAAHLARPAAFTDAFQLVFTVATVVVLVAFALAWLIPEKPLRKTVETSVGVGESFLAPGDTDSVRELTRGLARLVGRERTLRFVEEATVRAGVEVAPGTAWLLLRAPAPEELPVIRTLPHVDPDGLDAAVADVHGRGWFDGGGVTVDGHTVRDRLVAARTACLLELIEDWEPHRYPELDPLLRRLAAELAQPPRQATVA